MGFLKRVAMRPFISAGYLVFFVLGIVTMIAPSPAFQEAGGSFLTYTWAGFLLLGGLLGLAEVFVGRFWLELCGLSLLVTAVLCYSIVLVIRSFEEIFKPPYAGCLILVCALLLCHRLIEIYRFLRSVRRL